MHDERHESNRTTAQLRPTPAWLGVATTTAVGAAAIAILYARRYRSSKDWPPFGFRWSGERAITVRAPLEEVEAAWTRWCNSGNSKLSDKYAVRFEPAPGARGTEVHLSGGGSKSSTREELRRIKQFIETGEVLISDGPGLWRPAQPTDEAHTATGVRP